MNVATVFGGAQGNELPNAYVATRGETGWQTTALSPPTLQAPANGTATISYAFSSDLSQVVLRVPFQRLSENAPAGVYNLFLRSASGGYSLLTSAAPAEPPPDGCGGCWEDQDVPAFAGASDDFSHVLFEANDGLLAGAPAAPTENLYEAAAGGVRLVGVLPDNTVAQQGATAGSGINPIGEQSSDLDRAISQDGSHVLFQAKADGGAPDPQQLGETELYDRIEGSSTVEVSAPAPGAEPSRCETSQGICDAEPAQFWTAAADGSLVYFTSKAALTKDSYTGDEEQTGVAAENPGNDLYRYEVNTGSLTDLTVDVGSAADPNGADVLGVVGSSEDGSYVYFVADGRLAEGALSGQPNLYVWHSTAASTGTIAFISTLRAATAREERNIEAIRVGSGFLYNSDIADWTRHPIESQAYVTPDGRHLAFMSVNPLTGYDNEDQGTHEADHEVFEYSAETGQLVCGSCDSSGARPLGSAFTGAKLSERASTPFHQPRTLSDDGSRLFFSSPDPLVPGLSGGSVKVFEYENGAAQLISGMGDGSDDVFLDASASGNDVFFATREQLVPGDRDELVDVYDARVDGGLPTPPAPTPPCTGSACQGPASSVAVSPLPASASFSGAGDLAPPVGARLTDKQLLARALTKCVRLKSRRRRSSCIAFAKRRYAPKSRKRQLGTVHKHHHRRPG